MMLMDHQQAIAQNKRLEQAAWGLVLILAGALFLIPDEQVPSGTWAVGFGLILLGLNLNRFRLGIKMSGFTLLVGIVSLLTGLWDLFLEDAVGFQLDVVPIVLILIGLNILFRFTEGGVDPTLAEEKDEKKKREESDVDDEAF
jgi:hypothetical protein